MERNGKKGSGLLKWGIAALCAALLLLIGSIAFAKYVPTLSEMVGTALGSWQGVMQGITSGAEAGLSAGKEKGLSAKDTTVRIGSKMNETGKLQVMLVDLKLTDLYQQGSAPDYAALWTMEGNGVFTVDLTQAKAAYHETENKITIEIPKPEFTPYLDDTTVKLIAKYQRDFFNGNTDNGYQGYLNSRTQINQKAQEEMLAMRDCAEECALRQVDLLAKSVCGRTVSVDISFSEPEE